MKLWHRTLKLSSISALDSIISLKRAVSALAACRSESKLSLTFLASFKFSAIAAFFSLMTFFAAWL